MFELLFDAAFPRSPAALRRAEQRLRQDARSSVAGRKRPPDDSGLPGSTLTASFSPELTAWLLARYPRAIRPVDYPGDWGPEADELFPLLVTPAEADGYLSPRLDRAAWLLLVTGGRDPFRWVVEALCRMRATPGLRDRLTATLPLDITWRLGQSPSRTLLRFPGRRRHTGPIERSVDLPALLGSTLPRPAALDRRQTANLIAIARETLAVRGRETDPVTYADPRDVTLYRLERGTDVALFGLEPSRRLAVETYVGFVAARNGIPVAYGGGWSFFGRLEIGVNLFPEFRGGESAWLFGTVLRVYRHRFRARQFLVDPYQIGAGNTEAIQSGAFWFYYRLGFRPTDSTLRRLADREAQRLAAKSSARSSPSLLRRLAGAPLFLNARTGRPTGAWTAVAPEPTALALAVTRGLAHRSAGDRSRAEARAVNRARRLLHVRDQSRWTADEREWFTRMAPLVALTPGLERRTRADRDALLAVIRAKGGRSERRYALGLQRLVWWREILMRMS